MKTNKIIAGFLSIVFMISALTVCVYAYVDSNKTDEANQPMAVMATAEIVEEEPFEA